MPIDLPPPDPGFEILVASRGMSKGLAQTNGPQIIPRAFVQMGPVQLGGQWKNIHSASAGGEASLFAGWQRKFGNTQVGLTAAYKFLTSPKEPVDDKSFEFTGTASHKWGKVGARLSAVYSPDDLGSTTHSLYLEGGPAYDVTKTIRISGNIGHRSRGGGPDYTTFNAGVSKVVGKMTVDARYYDTNEGDLGEIYHARGVVSARIAL